MKAEKITLLTGSELIVLLAVLIVWQADLQGVSAAKLEQYAMSGR